jgi:hypothetical protein
MDIVLKILPKMAHSIEAEQFGTILSSRSYCWDENEYFESLIESLTPKAHCLNESVKFVVIFFFF